MKRKLLISIAILFGVIAIFIAGVATSSYFFSKLEFNDRLKYEAAYLRGYVGTQKMIKSGDIKKAEEIIDLLIDSHVLTLNEFRFFKTDDVSYEINRSLCKAVLLRKEYPRTINSSNNEENKTAMNEWYKDIDKYLTENEIYCE